jgi:hypothetical protein
MRLYAVGFRTPPIADFLDFAAVDESGANAEDGVASPMIVLSA